ncbi:hypothetical protein PGT21_009216 [Puccinia graminis f. sp. tritici]|uniref:Uncharacterized protein n=1 Tax=Puccinia graminis f. sp. tritici TaxID=56615 RepID=A0A5B0MN77_PUCGR|nr:hypothetical protein PGT21_009216 [Puccinia graminis f. sp. tritici]
MAVEVLNQAIRTQATLETAVGTDRMRDLCENWNPRTDLTTLEVNQRQMNQAQQNQQNRVNSAPPAPAQNAYATPPFYQAPYQTVHQDNQYQARGTYRGRRPFRPRMSSTERTIQIAEYLMRADRIVGRAQRLRYRGRGRGQRARARGNAPRNDNM